MADQATRNDPLERLEALREKVDDLAKRCGADELELSAWPSPKLTLIQGGQAAAPSSD